MASWRENLIAKQFKRMDDFVSGAVPAEETVVAVGFAVAAIDISKLPGRPGITDLLGPAKHAVDAVEVVKLFRENAGLLIVASDRTVTVGQSLHSGLADWEQIMAAPLSAVTNATYKRGLQQTLSFVAGDLAITGNTPRLYPRSYRYYDLEPVARALGWRGA